MSFAHLFDLIELGLTFHILIFDYIIFLLNKLINKEKTLSKETRGEKRKDKSLNKRPYPKVQNAQWAILGGENTKPRT
jgi:hypothetical protein